MKVFQASQPFWGKDCTSIELRVVFEELIERGYWDVPFTASPDDPEPHGRDLFWRAAAGEFGEVQ